MTAPAGASRYLTLTAGYATGAALIAWGTYLFWLPGLSQEQVLLTGVPLVGGFGLIVSIDALRRRTAAPSV